MNCRDYEEMLKDTERGVLSDAVARDEATAHEAGCRSCAARLADERTLTAGLRALAARDASHEATPRVEAALLAAFRAAHSAPPPVPLVAAETSLATGTQAAPGVVLSFAERRALRRGTWMRGFAAAATAVAAAAAFLMIVVPGGAPPTRDAQPLSASLPSTSEPETAAITSRPILGGDVIEEQSTTPRTDTDALSETQGRPMSRLVKPARSAGAQQPRMTLAGYKSGGGSSRTSSAVQAGDDEDDEEFTTDFIPINQMEQAAPVIAGQLVRVELPRSALSRFGMTVSAERATERIKADVLLGEDGLAQAIRFVR